MSGWSLALGVAVQSFGWSDRTLRHGLIHVGAVAALGLLLSRPLVDAIARALLGLRGPVVAWRALSAGALAYGIYDLYSLRYALGSRWSFFSYFGRFWELEPEAFIVPVTVLVAAAVLARSKVVSSARLRSEALLAVGLALVMVTAGLVRAVRSPAIDRYVPSLTRLGVIPSEPTVTRGGDASSSESSSEYADHSFGAVTVRRFVFRHRGQCALLVAQGDAALPRTLASQNDQLTNCESREVRIDARRGLVTLSQSLSWGDLETTGYGRDRVTPVRGDAASMGHLREAFTIPRAWLGTSAVMLVVAIGFLSQSIAAKRALRDRAGWRQATLGADGMISLEGVRVPVPYGAMLVPGPVVLLRTPSSQTGAPFRDGVSTLERDEIIGGTLADYVGAREASVDASRACAIAASLLSAAPLVAAAIEGLLP
jgi:hypothetical protein